MPPRRAAWFSGVHARATRRQRPRHTPEEALDILVDAVRAASYRPGDDVALALDPAASLQPGDLLALVTDGLLEVFDTRDRELGLAGVRQLPAAHHDRPLAEIAERLLAQARAHGPQLDDQTILLIHRLGG